MVDFASFGGVGSKCEGFGSNCGSYVNVDLSAEFAERHYILLEFSNCQLGARLSPPLGWYPADIVYRIIESVRLEQRTVLLSIDTLNSRLNVVNCSGFDNCPAQFHMVANKCAILALLIFSDNIKI